METGSVQEKQKWLIYGGRGWIGTHFLKYIPENKEIIHGKSRGDDYISLQTEITSIKPNRVISFIGRTRAHQSIIDSTEDEREKMRIKTIDWLEQNLEINLRDNFLSAINLQKITADLNIHFTHMSTGCIFSYFDNDPLEKIFDEDDLANFKGSSYSMVKGMADTFFHNCENVLNVRFRLPITYDLEDDKNLLCKLIKYKTINSTPNSVSVLSDILPEIVFRIESAATGTYNMTNPGYITHDEILALYKEIINPEHEYILLEDGPEKDRLNKCRSNCILKSSFGKCIPTAQESVRKIFESWKMKKTSE